MLETGSLSWEQKNMISFSMCLCECVGKKHGFYVCVCVYICIYRYMYVSGVYIYVHLGDMCVLAYVHIYPIYLYMHTYVLEPGAPPPCSTL